MFVRRVVIQGHDHNRSSSGPETARVSALGWIALHPFHLGVKPAREPLLQAALFGSQRLGANNSGFRKAKLQRPRLDPGSARNRGIRRRIVFDTHLFKV
jgi:hypothetical protein